MKFALTMMFLLTSNFAQSNIDRLTNTGSFNCGEKEAIKINMQSISSATLECRKFGQSPGDLCGEDSECSSACCAPETGRCRIHDPASGQFCSKPAGQSCKDSSYCQTYPITKCIIALTGDDGFGHKTCALRCYTKSENGECINNFCTPPAQPRRPSFDINDPNRCDNATKLPF
jgi:hypothetical protein